MDNKYLRIIDANGNRAVEGLRVLEEISRFVLDDKILTNRFKSLRASIRRAIGFLGINERRSGEDVGREIYSKLEAKRTSLLDIFAANVKRIQEALRVLEEFSKIIDGNAGNMFKLLRFETYELEKEIFYTLSKRLKLVTGLYLITDPSNDPIKTIKSALKAGVKIVQLRDKQHDKAYVYCLAKEIKTITDKYHAAFIINDHVDIAKAVDADGVHIGKDDASLKRARKLLGRSKIIGVSVKNLSQARTAQKHGADYVGVGPVFATPNKNEKPVGLRELEKIVRQMSIPVVAIGGINKNNIKKVLKTGCQIYAAIRGAMDLLFFVETPQ